MQWLAAAVSVWAQWRTWHSRRNRGLTTDVRWSGTCVSGGSMDTRREPSTENPAERTDSTAARCSTTSTLKDHSGWLTWHAGLRSLGWWSSPGQAAPTVSRSQTTRYPQWYIFYVLYVLTICTVYCVLFFYFILSVCVHAAFCGVINAALLHDTLPATDCTDWKEGDVFGVYAYVDRIEEWVSEWVEFNAPPDTI